MKISFRKERAHGESLCGNCASCKYAIKLTISDDYLCNRHGIVDENFTCKHYSVNHLIKRTPRNRNINRDRFENKFTRDDFRLVSNSWYNFHFFTFWSEKSENSLDTKWIFTYNYYKFD